MPGVTDAEITVEHAFIDDGLEYEHGRSPGNADERKKSGSDDDFSAAECAPGQVRCRTAEYDRAQGCKDRCNEGPKQEDEA